MWLERPSMDLPRIIIGTGTGCGIPITGGFQDLTEEGSKQSCLCLVLALL